jgi:CubicO group peptidase (beta-lactamase class C family)
MPISPVWRGSLGVVLALSVGGSGLAGQASRRPTGAQVDSAVRSIMAKRHLPSLAFAVVSGGVVVAQSVTGLADIERAIPATAETRYPIASATKSIAAVTLMRWVEAGKLSLSDTLGGMLPDLPAAWKGVTVSRILSHTSGLPDVLEVPGQGPVIAHTGEEALAKLGSKPLDFAPGERWAYNQTNYYLVRRLIEWASGRSFESEVERQVLAPLGMTATGYQERPPGDPLGVAVYRVDSAQKVVPASVMPFDEFLRAAAGINTTLVDWTRWLVAVTERRLLGRQAWDELLTPVTLRDGSVFRIPRIEWAYGHGFVIADRAKQPWIGHSGGGRAAFRVYPGLRLGVLVMTNTATDPDGLADDVAALYLPGPPRS